MMTDRESESSQHCPLANIPGFRLLRKFLLVLVITLPGVATLAANDILKAGQWKGTFMTHDGTLYKIRYIVSYDDDSEKTHPGIKMINLDLEPVSEFTYRLSDIKIGKNTLQFRIPKEFETKECTLKKKNGSYYGTCRSDAGGDGESSEITMEAPPDIERSDSDRGND